MWFAKKPVEEMSENVVQLLDAVNDSGIGNNNNEFFSFLFVLCTIVLAQFLCSIHRYQAYDL